jgi:hypothetical protein
MGTKGSFPGGEFDQSPPSSAEVKMNGAISPLPHYANYGVVLSLKKSTGTTLPLSLPLYWNLYMTFDPEQMKTNMHMMLTYFVS